MATPGRVPTPVGEWCEAHKVYDCDERGPCKPGRVSSAAKGFLRAWSKHENAPRTVCPECHFESSEGYPSSHAPGCSRDSDGWPDNNDRSLP